MSSLAWNLTQLGNDVGRTNRSRSGPAVRVEEQLLQSIVLACLLSTIYHLPCAVSHRNVSGGMYSARLTDMAVQCQPAKRALDWAANLAVEVFATMAESDYER